MSKIFLKIKLKGQSLVEFSLVLVLFLIILLATLDWGFYLYSNTILDMAVRDAVRTSVTFSDWSSNYTNRTSQIKDIIEDRASFLPANVQSGLRSRIYLTFTPSLTDPDSITVEVRNQPFQALSGFLNIVLPSTISTRATMRYEH